MSATIRDVAREADVSVATVSRVFNESDKVREETRERVIRAARSLRYVPNETARSLIMQRTQTLGVLLPDMHGEFFAQVIRGLDRTARANDYHLLLSSSHSDEEEARAILRALLGRVDGLIIMWPRLATDFFTDLIPNELPVVFLNTRDKNGTFTTLHIDNYGGAYAIVRHLIEHGHERIALLTGPSDNRDAEERLTGYRDAVRDLGAQHDEALEIDGDFMRATGLEQVSTLLALDPRPTALFAANDAMAIGALHGLREAGVDVPGDMVVVGFDDIPTTRYVSPPLTTVHVPIQELGQRAIQHLLDRLQTSDEALPAHETLATELVLRRSCGCAPA